MAKTITFLDHTRRNRPGRVARLKIKVAKANQEAEQLRSKIEVLQLENATYKEQNAALYLMLDTQSNRVTKLINMLEKLTNNGAY